MSSPAFFNVAVALGGGLLAQVLASHLGMPSIVLLLGMGALLGPDVLAWLDPGALAAGRSDIVALAVTVILFEGGLGLDLGRLREQRRPLLLLIVAGGAISMLAGTLAAHYLLGTSWSIAVLYGALMIVTGPTVVTPLLARMTLDRRVRDLLVSEGVLIDPVGAIVALVSVEVVLQWHDPLTSGWLILVRLGVGAAAGFAAGRMVAALLKRGTVPEELSSPVVLGTAILVAALSSHVSEEAGLMSAVVQGVTLANAGVRDIGLLREFKERVTVLLLSFVFVLLAADVRLADVVGLGWSALLVVAVLVWIARPLGVLLATVGSELAWRERAFVAWICPRGIVAASVAGLYRVLLDDAEVPGGAQLEALVFLTVAATVTVQGMSADAVARLLKLDFPSVRGMVIVGGNTFARLLARTLMNLGRQVVIVDRSSSLCRHARDEHFSVCEGDALSVECLEEAGTRYADTVLTLTSNQELNSLVLARVRANFPVERLLGVVEDDPDTPRDERMGLFPGNFPGIADADRAARLGALSVVEYPLGDTRTGERLDSLPYASGEFALVVARDREVTLATADHVLQPGDRVWCAKPPTVTSSLASRPGPDPEPAGADRERAAGTRIGS